MTPPNGWAILSAHEGGERLSQEDKEGVPAWPAGLPKASPSDRNCKWARPTLLGLASPTGQLANIASSRRRSLEMSARIESKTSLALSMSLPLCSRLD